MRPETYTTTQDLYWACPPEDDYVTVGETEGGAPIRAIACLLEPPRWPWRKAWLDTEAGKKKMPVIQHYSTGEILFLESYAEFEAKVELKIDATRQRWEADGYSSAEEFAAAQMRGLRRLPRILRDLKAEARQRKPRDPAAQQPGAKVKFSPRDLSVSARDHYRQSDIEQIKQLAGEALVLLCRIADLVPGERQLKPALAGRMRELIEREISSCTSYGLKVAAQMKAATRASLNSEIDQNNIDKLEHQRHALRIKFCALEYAEQGLTEAYGEVMAEYEKQFGSRWYQYKSIAKRAHHKKVAVSDAQQAEKVRHTMANLLPPHEFARWVQSLNKVERGLNGVNEADEGLSERQLRQEAIREDFTSDNVRRPGMASHEEWSDEDLAGMQIIGEDW